MLDTNPPRGLRDFFPEDLVLRDRIFAAWSESATEHGFLRYEAPVVESYELLARKAGEEISEQIYNFTDKSGRKLALRPEVTPSLVRMLSAWPAKQLLPVKWWTIAQCFRYEKMGKGRRREHYQWNLDIIGSRSVFAEVWLLHCAVAALRKLGFAAAEIRIHVSHRRLLAEALGAVDIPEPQHLPVFLVLDKKDKVAEDVLLAMLAEQGVTAAQCRQLLEIMQTDSLEALAALPVGATPPADQLRQLFQIADALGFADWLKLNLGVVRGLAYYTGMVFECYDVAKKYRAIFGGGRYDGLFARMTNHDLPAVGLGFGDVVIGEILASRPDCPPPALKVDVCVGAFDGALEATALRIAALLAENGVAVDLAIEHHKAQRFFSYAAKRGAAWTVFVAPDELRQDCVVLKNMTSRQQEVVPIAALPARLAAEMRQVLPEAG